MDIRDVPVYVITLSRTPERTAFMRKQLKKRGYRNVQFIEGIEGSSLTRHDINRASRKAGHGMLPNEVGCSMAHVKAWTTALREWLEEQPCAVVLENDVTLTEPADSIFRYLDELPPNKWDVLYLGWSDYFKKGSTTYKDHLIKPRAPMGAYSYAISKRGLEKLLMKARNRKAIGFQGEVDVTMAKMTAGGHLSVFACNPPMAKHAWNFTSSILGNGGGGKRGGESSSNGRWFILLVVVVVAVVSLLFVVLYLRRQVKGNGANATAPVL